MGCASTLAEIYPVKKVSDVKKEEAYNAMIDISPLCITITTRVPLTNFVS
ncbi:MAG: hypothetical protein ACI8RD_013705 [Bacillariaceae sp.]|jgi:hypothetical protein